MKRHLVKLLLEEYKLDSQLDELENMGFDLSSLEVNNLAVILDIIGFPPENSYTEIEKFDGEGGKLILNKSSKDEDFFSRDDLFDKYYKIAGQLRDQKKVVVTTKGLKINSGIDIPEVEKTLLEFIEWLYVEVSKLPKK